MPRRKDKNSKLVYSTETGRIKPEKDLGNMPEIRDEIVRLRRETKGRGGKTVTTVSGIGLPNEELLSLAGEMKRYCGSGGTMKDGLIIIQGDHRDKLLVFLIKKGFHVKKAGG
jgi:translation initiation factor 1